MSEISRFISLDDDIETNESYSIFKACQMTNLPAKRTFMSKLKSILFTEITIKITPYEERMKEKENKPFYQPETWGKIKNFFSK